MAGFVAVVAAALFLGAVVALGVVASAVRREERSFTLACEAPGRLARSARRLNGVGRRGLAASGPVLHG